MEFTVEDWVYLKLRPYRQVSVAKRRNEKLAHRYFGSYQVLEKIGRVTYKLKLPVHSSIHSVFYMSKLKVAVPATHHSQELPVILSSNLELLTEPESLLDVCRSETGQGTEVLVQWK